MDYGDSWIGSVVDMSINEISGVFWICAGAGLSMWLGYKMAYAKKIQQVFTADEATWMMALNSLAWGVMLFGIVLFSQ